MRISHDDNAYAQARVQASRGGTGTAVVRHTVVPGTTVRQSREPYHQMQGWRYANHAWTGNYRTPGLECPGQIWQHYTQFCARIANVPNAVLNGRHGACFAPDSQAPGWYRIHFATMPRTVDGAILAVEQTLQESCR